MTERAAQRLPQPADVLELDVNKPEDLEAVTGGAARAMGRSRRRAARDRLRAPGRARRQVHDGAGRERGRRRFTTSAFSLKALAGGAGAADGAGGEHRRAGLRRLAWRGRSTTGWGWPRRRSSRCRAIWPATSGPQGVSVNLVSAGPLGTVAAHGIPGFEQLAELWRARRRSGGTSRIRCRWRARSAGCCRTTPRGSAARSSMSTVDFMRWGRPRGLSRPLARGDARRRLSGTGPPTRRARAARRPARRAR